jgi:P27 family predicted phage terminase small subunit
MLEGAATAYERAKQADAIIKQVGIMVMDETKDRAGTVVHRRAKNNPAIATSHSSWALVRSFCSEFGLSPVGRQRLEIQEADSSRDDLVSLLSQPRAPKNKPVVN